jgi:hypothetical protein
VVLIFFRSRSPPAQACCPAPPQGRAAVNADQTVILVWDAVAKTEHFIRRATFKGDTNDFGFIVPTPNQPELAESGDAAFPAFAKITAPEVHRVKRSPWDGAGCGGCLSRSAKRDTPLAASAPPQVLEQKTVAGFHAVVLEAESATALTGGSRNTPLSPDDEPSHSASGSAIGETDDAGWLPRRSTVPSAAGETRLV